MRSADKVKNKSNLKEGYTMQILVREDQANKTRSMISLRHSSVRDCIVSLIVMMIVCAGFGELSFAQSFSQQFSFNQQAGGRIVPGQKLHFQLIAGAIPVPIPATELQYEVNLDGELALQSLFAQASFANATATATYDPKQVHPGKVLTTGIRWNVADGQLTIDAGAPTISLSSSVRYRLCNTSNGICTPWTIEQSSVGTCDVHITIPNTSIPPFGGKQVSDEILLFYIPLEIPGIGGIDFGVDGEALFSLANQRIQDANGNLDSIPLTPSPGPGWTSNGTTIDFQDPIKSQAAIGSQLAFHMDFTYLADLEAELRTKSVFVGFSVGLPCVGASYERKLADVDFHLLTQTLTRFWTMPTTSWDYGKITVVNQSPTVPNCTPIQPFKKNRPGRIQVIADDLDNVNFGHEEIQYTIDWSDGTPPDRKSTIAGIPFTVDHTYAQATPYPAQMSAEDHHGARSQTTCNVNVGLGLAPNLLSASLSPSIVRDGKRWVAGTVTVNVTFKDDDTDDYVSLIQLFITPAGGQRRLVASVMNNNPDEPNGINLSYVWNTKADADKVGSFDIEACAQDKLDAQLRCTPLVPEPNPVWVDNEPPVASMEQPANGQTVQVDTVTPEVQARAFDAHGVGTQSVDFEYAEYNGSCGSFSAGTFQSMGGDGLIYKALFNAPGNNKQYCVHVRARDSLNNIGAWSAPPTILDVRAVSLILGGRVVYKLNTNLGINGATVTATAGFTQSTKSGLKGDGFYSLSLPKGIYTACAEQGGAKDCKTVTLDANKGQDFELDLPIPDAPPVEKVKLSIGAVALVRQGVFVISVPVNVLVQVNGAPLTTPASVQLEKNKSVLLVTTQTRITLSGKRYKLDRWECDGKIFMATTVMFTLTKDTACTAVYVEELG